MSEIMASRPQFEGQILQVLASISKESGGVAFFIKDLCDNLAKIGASGSILTTSRGDVEELSIAANFPIEHVVAQGRMGAVLGALATLSRARQILARKEVSVVHSHGLWLLSEHFAVKQAKAAGVPYMISPHGMLEEWALNHGRLKKKIARNLFQDADLRGAAAFHVTCQDELTSLRKAGFLQPAAVIPPGVEVPELLSRSKRNANEKRTALFLSRVHPKKGLVRLLQIWAAILPKDWQLVIAGNDDGGHRAELEKIVLDLCLGNVVSFTGPVFDEEKERLFAEADVFLLPTFSENFGIVVAEALVRGVPVLTTTGTPWQELNDVKCGWCVGLEDQEVETALRMILKLPDETLVEMGLRGREHIIENYSWPVLASRMLEFYQWVAHQADRPDFVF